MMGEQGLRAGTEVIVRRDTLLEFYKEIAARVGVKDVDLEKTVPTVSSPVEWKKKPHLVNDRASFRPGPQLVIPKTTWATERSRLRRKPFADGMPERKLRYREQRLSCVCPASVRIGATTCDHIKYGYLFGKDAECINYEGILKGANVSAQVIHFPVGMGHYWPMATITLNPGGTSIGVISALDTAACRHLGWSSTGYIMGLNEGMMGYIQYIEDLLAQTKIFEKANTEGGADRVSCAVRHGNSHHTLIVAALRSGNADRNNWMLANAAILLDTNGNTCLACHKLEIGKNDVPDF
jgi:hypothetical protein